MSPKPNMECAGDDRALGGRDASRPEENGNMSPQSKFSWPHAPPHWLFEPGIYMVTAGTYEKTCFFGSPDRLNLLLREPLNCARQFRWELQAWAVMANHHHFIARAADNPTNLSRMMGKLHMITAKAINALDGAPGRKVWYQFWDSHISYQRSYLARLHYVHQNPVHHGLTSAAENYPWCSAAWFERSAPISFVKTVNSCKCDRIHVYDEF